MNSFNFNEITHHFVLLTCHFQEGKNVLFDVAEKSLGPPDRSCHRRLILIQRWIVLLCFKDFLNAVNLLQEIKTFTYCTVL